MRNITPAMDAALTAPVVWPILIYEATFASGVARLWSGVGDITWAGQTWVGGGNFLSFGGVDEGTDVVARGSSVSLSGVPVGLVSAAISDAQQGLPGRVWVGSMDSNGQVTADPVSAFMGRLDVPAVTDGAETCVVTINYESRLIDLTKPREWRYTHESQQQLYPGDLGFSFLVGIQDKELEWHD